MRITILILLIICTANDSWAEEAVLKKLGELMSNTLQQRAKEWLCEPVTMTTCSLDGCKKGDPSVWVKIDFDESTYSRCDQKGCDSYPMTQKASGMYTIIELPGKGTFLKVLNNGDSYLEVAAISVSVVLNFGSCKPIG